MEIDESTLLSAEFSFSVPPKAFEQSFCPKPHQNKYATLLGKVNGNLW